MAGTRGGTSDGQDDARAIVHRRHARLSRGQRCILRLAEEPQVAAHQSVAITKLLIKNKLAAKRGNPPHLAAKAFDWLLKSVAEVSDLFTDRKLFGRID